MGKGPLWLGQTYLPQVTGEALRGLEPQRSSCFWAQVCPLEVGTPGFASRPSLCNLGQVIPCKPYFLFCDMGGVVPTFQGYLEHTSHWHWQCVGNWFGVEETHGQSAGLKVGSPGILAPSPGLHPSRFQTGGPLGVQPCPVSPCFGLIGAKVLQGSPHCRPCVGSLAHLGVLSFSWRCLAQTGPPEGQTLPVLSGIHFLPSP